MGEKVQEFENKFAEFVGAKFALMVNSGSSANLLAATSLQIKFPIVGDRNIVLVPTLSWSTTYFPLLQNGYELRFIDINLTDFNINIDEIEKAICSRTVGICVAHILGAEANIAKLSKICAEKNLWLFEDTCESLGNQPYVNSEKMLGAFGDAGTYSFFRSHHISTMEGGMFVTSDEETYIYASSIRNHGWARNIKQNSFLNNFNVDPWEEKFKFYLPGYNLRPLEMSGAVGIIQLQKINQLISLRKENANFLKSKLDSTRYHLQDQSPAGSWMAFSLLIKNQNVTRKRVIDELEKIGVETRPIVSGHFLNQPVINRIKPKIHLIGEYQNSKLVDTTGFMFANHGRILEKELIKVAEVLNEIS